jgi:hypothetical protein
MLVHFLRSGSIVIFLNSLKLASTLFREDGFDGSVSLVCTLRFSYLYKIIVPSIDAKRMSWISFIFLHFKIDALGFSGSIFRHHSLVHLQRSLLFNTGENQIGSVQVTQVSQCLAQQFLLDRLVVLRKFVVLGSNDGDWDKRSVDSFCVGRNFAPVGVARGLYLSEIVDFIIL